jgi:hypothetical protein
MRLLERFMDQIRESSMEDYVESIIAYFAAPTIVGIKCANLINLSRPRTFLDRLEPRESIVRTWDALGNALLGKFRLRGRVMSRRDDSALLLLYKERLLNRTLHNPEGRAVLAEYGYPTEADVGLHLSHLKKRFQEGFPHESGIFLDYPPEDVKGFIVNKGANSKACGYWKVYGDPARAEERFNAFRSAEESAVWDILRNAAERKKFSFRANRPFDAPRSARALS